MKKHFNWYQIFMITALIIGGIAGTYLLIRNHQTALLTSGCELPCWQGIVVGNTNRDELLEVLNQFQFINYTSVTNDSYVNRDYPEVIFYDLYPYFKYSPTVHGTISLSDDIVKRIVIEDNTGVNVKTAIEMQGYPEFVFSAREFYMQFWIFYPSIGMVMNVDVDKWVPHVSPNSKVDSIIIVESGEFDSLLDDFELVDSDGNSYVRSWSGYGEIEGKYWPPPRN